MGRQAEAKLTSEERCEKAFKEQFNTDPEDEEFAWDAVWLGWRTCWRYLQEHLAEYVAS